MTVNGMRTYDELSSLIGKIAYLKKSVVNLHKLLKAYEIAHEVGNQAIAIAASQSIEQTAKNHGITLPKRGDDWKYAVSIENGDVYIGNNGTFKKVNVNSRTKCDLAYLESRFGPFQQLIVKEE